MRELERRAPERIVLGVRPGFLPNGKPPVRIFLGTEASQFRPERVLAWSIEQVRDPARVYEIHLMKEIAGFDRSGWTTGFTNYRFAIPEWAGGSGRALYNDEDQIYLSDPALLFDADMGGHGFLAIAPRESSVMLIDCARMAGVWNLAAARRGTKKDLLRRAVEVPGLFGLCHPQWNARDDEYDERRSHCLHYTTLHTQPWRPFRSASSTTTTRWRGSGTTSSAAPTPRASTSSAASARARRMRRSPTSAAASGAPRGPTASRQSCASSRAPSASRRWSTGRPSATPRPAPRTASRRPAASRRCLRTISPGCSTRSSPPRVASC